MTHLVGLVRSSTRWTRRVLRQARGRGLVFDHDWTSFADAWNEAYEGRRVVLLARDPRDAALSWYWFKVICRRVKSYKTTGLVPWYQGELGLTKFVRWLNHWAEGRHRCECLLARYEDLIGKRQAEEFQRILDFAGPAERGRPKPLEDVLAHLTLEHMRKKRPAHYPVARAGRYREELPKKVVEWADGVVRRELDEWYGYK